jgi:flagellar basal body rod protein FlgB
MSSFSIALSGLTAASSDLDVTANNIANADTVGFKSSRAEFGDVYASGAVNLNHLGDRRGRASSLPPRSSSRRATSRRPRRTSTWRSAATASSRSPDASGMVYSRNGEVPGGLRTATS